VTGAGRRLLPAAVAAGLLLATTVPPHAAPADPDPAGGDAAELARVRQECADAARTVQQRERAVAALDLAVGAMQRDDDAKEAELQQRVRQDQPLLAALERLARARPDAASEAPLDRQRSAILQAAARPALEAQAKTLADQLAALAAERGALAARRQESDAARQALDKARDALPVLIAHRADLIAGMLPEEGKVTAVMLGNPTGDVGALIKRADADNDQRDRELVARLPAARIPLQKGALAPALADPTRPAGLRALDATRATMVWPVFGTLDHRFGEPGINGKPIQGLSIGAAPAALVVAPFDGRVDYAGPLRGYGLILIIRHDGGYHSLLAGLGQVNVTIGQWLLAGEPVGAMPGSDSKDASTNFYLELRRKGRPVDPQARLASRDEAAADNKVRE